MVPILASVKLDPARSEVEVMELLKRWMSTREPEIGFVREVLPAQIDWSNPIVLENLSSGWANPSNAKDIIKLVGFIPVVEDVEGQKLDLLIYLLCLPGKPQELRFWWDTRQDAEGAVRSTERTQTVVDAFGQIDFELLRS